MNRLLQVCAICVIVGAAVAAAGHVAGAGFSAEPSTEPSTVPTPKAQPNTHAAALPDWSGEWEMVGLTPNDGGLYVESAEEIASRWNQPQFNTDLKQRAFRAKVEQTMLDAVRTGAAQPGPPGGFACTFGFPMLMLESPATFEVLLTPRQTSLIFSTREVRNVYTDRRAHTPEDEIWPTYWGDSIGHWEGQTLVIDTIAATSPFLPAVIKKTSNVAAVIGLAGGGGGAPKIVAAFSPLAHYSERIRKLDTGELEMELTVRDPAALSAPWRLVRHYRRMAGVTRMIFQDCEGDTRHEIVNGQVTLKLSR